MKAGAAGAWLGALLLAAAGDAAARRIAPRPVLPDGGATDDAWVEPTVRPWWRLWPKARRTAAWLVLARASGAVDEGRLRDAWTFAREALALLPADDAVRTAAATLFAYDVPPRLSDAGRRVAWVLEGLAVLEEGLALRPDSAYLRIQRAHLLFTRPRLYPEFAESWRRRTGRSAVEEAVDEFLRAARSPSARPWMLRWAAIALETRGDLRLAEARRTGDPDLADSARSDFEEEERLLGKLLEVEGLRREAIERDLRYARAAAQLADLERRRLSGGKVDAAEIRRLERTLAEVVEERRREGLP